MDVTRCFGTSAAAAAAVEYRIAVKEQRQVVTCATRRHAITQGLITSLGLLYSSKSYAFENIDLGKGTRFVTGDKAFPSFSSPEPVAIPRRTLRPDFAISLLRSGYETADSLDFVAMDKFQQDFWLSRRAEWESYKLLYDPIVVEQGKVADPLYFDFISAIQFETISKEMRNGKQVFKEFCGDACDEEYVIVTRSPELQDNQLLPGAFYTDLGALLYNKLSVSEDFQQEVVDVISASMKPLEIARVVEMYFQKLGYCVKFEMDHDSQGNQFTIRSYGGVNAFALQYLSSKGSSIFPVYDGLLLAHIFDMLGFSCSTISVTWSNLVTTQTFTFKQ
jgi:hypothetical protein